MCLENMIMLRMSSFNLLAALSIFAVLVIQITTTEACRGGRIVGKNQILNLIFFISHFQKLN